MNIYIGNLYYRVRVNDLKEVMEQYGPISSIKLIMDRDTGRSKGYAFVEMEEAAAKEMIAALNGTEFQGRTMVIKEAAPRS